MLARLKDELLTKAADKCLPRNLSDEWLSILADSAENLLGESSKTEGQGVSGALCLTIVLHLVQQKTSPNLALVKVTDEQLFEYVQFYQIELAFEELHRHTDIKYEPATLETILTKREVTGWRE